MVLRALVLRSWAYFRPEVYAIPRKYRRRPTDERGERVVICGGSWSCAMVSCGIHPRLDDAARRVRSFVVPVDCSTRPFLPETRCLSWEHLHKLGQIIFFPNFLSPCLTMRRGMRGIAWILVVGVVSAAQEAPKSLIAGASSLMCSMAWLPPALRSRTIGVPGFGRQGVPGAKL